MTRRDDQVRYNFTLTLSASELTDQIEQGIYALGVDEVLVGEQQGRVFVDFDVPGNCMADAIMDAIDLVEKALPGVTVLEVHSPGEEAIKDANSFLRTRMNPKLSDKLRHQD